MIRFVEQKDKAEWYLLDHDFPESGFDEKVRNNQGYVYIKDGKIIGILRFNLFWDSIPFCTMLHIDETYHGNGYGKELMERWEKDMKKAGCGMLMTSTQVNENAQHFYRKLGYKDAGGFVVDVPGCEQPMELIMIKGL
ncbi:MAG: GNAT family N-acetyltransferase [Erysipelotrichaceae bacterium]|nr:GNAT family N-acetyltransferase [Erysipelotrichaceae bacterium]